MATRADNVCRSLNEGRTAGVRLSLQRQKLDADRHGNADLHHFSHFAGLSVHAKHDEIVAVLIARKQKSAGGIEIEVAGGFAQHRLMSG